MISANEMALMALELDISGIVLIIGTGITSHRPPPIVFFSQIRYQMDLAKYTLERDYLNCC
jgi:hypothetical protein